MGECENCVALENEIYDLKNEVSDLREINELLNTNQREVKELLYSIKDSLAGTIEDAINTLE